MDARLSDGRGDGWQPVLPEGHQGPPPMPIGFEQNQPEEPVFEGGDGRVLLQQAEQLNQGAQVMLIAGGGDQPEDARDAAPEAGIEIHQQSPQPALSQEDGQPQLPTVDKPKIERPRRLRSNLTIRKDRSAGQGSGEGAGDHLGGGDHAV